MIFMPSNLMKAHLLDQTEAAVVTFWQAHGYGLTVRDLADALGLTSTAAYHRMLAAVKVRRIAYDPGVERSIRPRNFGSHWRGEKYHEPT